MTLSQSWTRSIGLALGGPILLGTVLGVPYGLRAMAVNGALLPAIILGVGLLMTPALYIGLSLVGTAPPAAHVVKSLGSGLRTCGIILVGLAPASLFLLATNHRPGPIFFIGFSALLAGVIAGLRTLFIELQIGSQSLLKAIPILGLWAAVCLGLGTHILLHSLVWAGGF